jgi:RNA polymerase sigma-70 factor (ECF subfamily)
MPEGPAAATADTASVRSAPARDDASFERGLRPLLEPAFRLAYTMLRDRQEAEDAVQQAALDAWRGFGRFRDEGRGMGPWFLTIVANQCRARRRTPWWRLGRPGDVDSEPGGAVPGHEDGVVLRDELGRSFGRLSTEQRTVLVLYFDFDLSQEEIARILRIRVGAVKSRLHRGVQRLRSLLEEGSHNHVP